MWRGEATEIGFLPKGRMGSQIHLLFTLVLFVAPAHHGASGYVPDHTREAQVMAHAMGVDFIEQDVVLS